MAYTRVPHTRHSVNVFARVLDAEARGEDRTGIGMKLVGTVSVNRVGSNCFPKIRTIEDVLSIGRGRERRSEFESVSAGHYRKARPTKRTLALARRLLHRQEIDYHIRSSIFFWNPQTTYGVPLRYQKNISYARCPAYMIRVPNSRKVHAYGHHCFYDPRRPCPPPRKRR